MSLLEPAPPEVSGALRRRLAADEEPLIQVASDLSADAAYRPRWLVVTRRRALVGAPGEELVEASLDGAATVRIRALVGGGCLEITPVAGPTLRVLYSASLGARFAEVARAIEDLRRDGGVARRGSAQRARCDRCARPLADGGGPCTACVSRAATLRRIVSLLAPHRKRVLLLAGASLLAAVSALLPPLVTGAIVDDVLLPQGADGARRLTLLLLLVLALLGAQLVGRAAEWVQGWTAPWLAARVTAALRSRVYGHLERMPVGFHDRHGTGWLMSRVSTDATSLQDFLVRGLPFLVINALTVVGVLAVAFVMSWQLALAVALPAAATLAWTLTSWRRIHPLFHWWSRAWSSFSGRVEETLSGIRVVKAFTAERTEDRRFARENRELLRAGVESSGRQAVLLATTGLVTSTGVLLLWLVGGAAVLDGQLTLGTLVAFYGYVLLLQGHLQWFGQISGWMTQALAGAERIFAILDAPPEPYDDPGAAPLARLEGRVAFRGVTFGYEPGEPVLREVDLEVAAGETVGVVGASGAGKTTLVNLISRFYEPDQGRVEVDGLDVRSVRLEDLRGQIGVVAQEPFLFSGTIAENIGYGRPGASFEQVVRAAGVANLHAAILAKPDGYDTEVGERGERLSGGERQRLALARAVLRDPRILILDEATSAVDTANEELIRQTVRGLARDRTVFVIAHRLSTVRGADRLVVLEAGRVVEVGTYDELVARDGAFRALVHAHERAMGPEPVAV